MEPKELGNNPDNRSQATPQKRRKWTWSPLNGDREAMKWCLSFPQTSSSCLPRNLLRRQDAQSKV